MSGCRSRQDLTFQYPCSFRFPLKSGGTEWARDAVPLAKRGEPNGHTSRFPSRSGGNLQEGGNEFRSGASARGERPSRGARPCAPTGGED